MESATVSARVPVELHKQVVQIAEVERRKVSNVVEMALECFVKQYTELHPQFRSDIADGLAQLDAGDVVAYERG